MSHRSLNRRRQREFDRMRETLLFQGEQEDAAERIAMSRVSRDLPVAGDLDRLAMVAQIRANLNGSQPARTLRSVGDDARSGRVANRRPGTGPGRPRRVVTSDTRRTSALHRA